MNPATCHIMKNLTKMFDMSKSADQRLFQNIQENNLNYIKRRLIRHPEQTLKIAIIAMLYKNESIFRLVLTFAVRTNRDIAEINFMMESIISQKCFSIKPYLRFITKLDECAQLAVMMGNNDALNHLLPKVLSSNLEPAIKIGCNIINDLKILGRHNEIENVSKAIEQVKAEQNKVKCSISLEKSLEIQREHTQCLVREIESLIVLYDI